MRPTDPAIPLETLLAERAWLQALARRLVADEATADDAAQETWLAAISRRPSRVREARAWLATVLRNALHDRRRADSRRTRRESAAARPEAHDADDVVARADVHLRLAQAVHDLDEPYRTTVLLRFFDGVAVDEVARRVGVSEEAVRKRIARAVAMLRARLDDRDRRAWVVLLLGRVPRRATPVAAAIGGLLMAKKLAVVAAVLVLALGGWYAARTAFDAPKSKPPVDVASAATAASPRPRAKVEETHREAPPSPAPVDELPGPKATGRVVGPDGKPVAGARVVSMPDDIRETVDPDSAGAKGGRTFKTTTDADGRFAVRLDDKAPLAMLFADAPGLAPASRVDVRPGDDVAIALEPAGVLAGTVMDLDGTPIAGARVRVLDLVDAARLVHSATSDAKGAYRLDGLPRKSARYVEVVADGWARLLIEQDPAVERRDLVLVRGAKLTGRVVDAETGAPIEGAHVAVTSQEGLRSFGRLPGGGWMNPWGGRLLGEATTAADGTFAVEHVPAVGFHPSASHNAGRTGSLLVGSAVAWKEGWSLHTVEVALAADGATVTADLKLWPAACIEGRAVLSDGRPATGAWVAADVEGRAESGYAPASLEGRGVPCTWTKADAAGAFRLDGVRAANGGPTRVKLRGHVADVSGMNGAPDGDATFEVRPGDRVGPVTLTLSDADVPMILLRVLDADGRPVWGAAFGLGDSASARTDADGRGRLVLGGLGNAAAEERDVIVRAKGLAPAAVRVRPAVGAAETAVTLGRAGRVAGRVRWSDGTPAVGVEVQARNAAVSADEAFPTGQAAGRAASARPPIEWYGSARTGDDGAFEIADLPEGRCHVAATTFGPPAALGAFPQPIRDVRANVLVGADDLVFVLPRPETPATQSVEGTIRDAATGRVVARAEILLVGAAEARSAEITAPGKFRFDAVPTGVWTLRAAVPGYAPFESPGLVVAAGEATTSVDVALDRGATIRGGVRAAVGALPDGAVVWLRSVASVGSSSVSTTARIAADGSFEATGLVPGGYRMTIGPAERGRPPLVPENGKTIVVADAHGAAAVDLAVVPSGTLQLTATDPRLPPAPWSAGPPTDEQRAFGAAATLEVLDAAGTLIASQRGLARGYVGAAGSLFVLPGSYVVRLLLPGDPPREERVEVAAGKATNVSLKPR